MFCILLSEMRCAVNNIPRTRDNERPNGGEEFLSAHYNHFESGVIFEDIESGIDVLWKASFRKGNPYKENVGLFVPGGLLILPNGGNDPNRGSIGALPLAVRSGNLFVLHQSQWLEVLSIIHTHPDLGSEDRPSPRNDYQYCYLGLHNYVMNHRHLFDAYKDQSGIERYSLLGARRDYHAIPFVGAALANRSIP